MKSRMLMSMLVICPGRSPHRRRDHGLVHGQRCVEPVTFTAGTLLIDLDDSQFVELDVDNLNPGDEKEWEITVENIGPKTCAQGSLR